MAKPECHLSGMKIYNRRYTGSKYKLTDWIKTILSANCPHCQNFFDVFGGTGIVTATVLPVYKEFIINDLLYANDVIYKGFFLQANYNAERLQAIAQKYNKIDKNTLPENYVSINYGGKFFGNNDAKLIGFIREDIEQKKQRHEINEKEYYILLTSLVYSFDKIANTVGHYEAYIKGKEPNNNFQFGLIEPFLTEKPIHIYRENANVLAKKIVADIAFIDPPYNSRQYSRFYHVPETIVKWDKPCLNGVAMKPPAENMSEYCRNNAPKYFAELINVLNVKYIAVTYNNTYNSKSSSSRNKITLEEITAILQKRGKTKIFQKNHTFFNAGKTDFADHKEFLFITEVS